MAATRMDLESVILSEASQTEKEWNLKRNDTNKLMYKTEIDAKT